MVYCADPRCAALATDGEYCNEHAGGPLTVYYWPVSGRVIAVLRMLEESKTPYTLKSDFGDIAAVSSGYGAKTTTFAPPILKDGDDLISQSALIAAHVGKRTGFDKGVDCSLKALQYMLDVNDFVEALTIAAKTVETAKAFLTAPDAGKLSHADEWLNNIENSIKGPYYFGERPTYVDFWLVQAMDWAGFVLLTGLRRNILANYPKVEGVLSGLRALESNKVLGMLPIGPPYAAFNPEFAAPLADI